MYVIVRTFLAASVFTAFLSSGQATALEVVYTNSGPGTTGVNISGSASTAILSLAQGFKTGGIGYYTPLQAVEMVFNFQNLGVLTEPDTYLQINLYGSTGTPLKTPDTSNLIASFDPKPDQTYDYSNPKAYTFNLSGGGYINLSTNTEYWVVVSSNRGITTETFNWGFADGGAADKPAAPIGSSSGYTYVGTVGQRADLGTTWQDYNGGLGQLSGVRFGLIIVPEPSTYALGIAGTLVMGAIARRKSRKAVKA